eukprot:TRINITY_DN3650_c0_g1_i1.p1 TRINITY_DN3650_c0_g1~~TRINITY_DN3650_c0_g1_i1.p1  ORF type:complete len:302 (+),score=60.87 TRINITY_DN3650_c0_g1_i1:55-906(+)
MERQKESAGKPLRPAPPQRRPRTEPAKRVLPLIRTQGLLSTQRSAPAVSLSHRSTGTFLWAADTPGPGMYDSPQVFGGGGSPLIRRPMRAVPKGKLPPWLRLGSQGPGPAAYDTRAAGGHLPGCALPPRPPPGSPSAPQPLPPPPPPPEATPAAAAVFAAALCAAVSCCPARRSKRRGKRSCTFGRRAGVGWLPDATKFSPGPGPAAYNPTDMRPPTVRGRCWRPGCPRPPEPPTETPGPGAYQPRVGFASIRADQGFSLKGKLPCSAPLLGQGPPSTAYDVR